jgi:hypothetical protein
VSAARRLVRKRQQARRQHLTDFAEAPRSDLRKRTELVQDAQHAGRLTEHARGEAAERRRATRPQRH